MCEGVNSVIICCLSISIVGSIPFILDCSLSIVIYLLLNKNKSIFFIQLYIVLVYVLLYMYIFLSPDDSFMYNLDKKYIFYMDV